METSTHRVARNKYSQALESLKQFHFYDTFVTRQDVVYLNSLSDDRKIKSALTKIIQRFEDAHKSGVGFKFEVYRLISFQYQQTQTISKATEESQQQCKWNIFCEFLSSIFKKFRHFTFEQLSAIMSIGFYVFVESLERKITQIDSYELFKRLVRPQVLLSNFHNNPLLSQQQVQEFNQFMTSYFYRYYSLFELRMTIYQEVNIYGRIKGENIPQHTNDRDKDSIQEEDEFNFREVDYNQSNQDEQTQEEPKINETDEKHIDELLQAFKLNYNNRLENSQILTEAEKILVKKK